MNMHTWSLVAGGLALLSGVASGEVITGSFPVDFIYSADETPQGGLIDVLGVNFEAYQEFVGSGYTNLYMGASSSDPQDAVSFLTSLNSGSDPFGFNYFHEGQSLLNHGFHQVPMLLGLMNSGNGNWDLLGTFAGDAIFVGFEIKNIGASEGNFGFIQLELAASGFHVRGWAYETETGADLMTFSVPSPSGVAVFGLAGLGLARRRR